MDKNGYGTRVCVRRRRAGTPICGQSHDQGQGAAHCSQYRKAVSGE